MEGLMAKYALVVGVDYKGNGIFNELETALGDAIEINDILSEFGYNSELFLGSRATAASIRKYVFILKDKLMPGDTFALYFSGHGFLQSDRIRLLAHPSPPDSIHLKDIESVKDDIISINLLECLTANQEVERIFLIDVCKKPLMKSEDMPVGINSITEKDVQATERADLFYSPFGLFCNCYKGSFLIDSENSKTSLFSQALIHIFNEQMQAGAIIKFPNICSKIIEEMTSMTTNPIKQAPYYKGDSIILQQKEHRPDKLTDAQTKVKKKADDLLDKVIDDHMTWLSEERPAYDNRQLKWCKLKPVFDMYKGSELGIPDLSRRKLDYADFFGAEFPKGTNFRESSLSSASFMHVELYEIIFFECYMHDCVLHGTFDLCDFSYATLSKASFGPKIINCLFERSVAPGSSFYGSKVINSSFQEANLVGTDFSNSLIMGKSDFTRANLKKSILVNADFSTAKFTGAKLYGTARADWKIENVICDYVYWDKDCKERFPQERNYEKDEFTKENKHYEEFSYTFEEGISPFDLTFATKIIELINKAAMGFEIGIKDISVHGLNPTLHFIMLAGADKADEAKETFRHVRKNSLEIEKSKPEMNSLPCANAAAESVAPAINALTGSEDSLFSLEMLQSFSNVLLTAQTLVSERADTFHRKEIEGCAYIALWGTGNTVALSSSELSGIQTELNGFMPGKCYLIMDSELNNLPEGSYLSGLYSGFNTAEPKDAYLAVAELLPEDSNQYVCSARYHELTLNPRSALTQCLSRIRDSLEYKSISDFNLPALHTTQRKMVCPDGPEIKRLRGMETIQEICRQKYSDPDGNTFEMAKTTLGRAERSIPHSKRVIHKIAWSYGVPIESLYFTRAFVRAQTLRKWRKRTGLSKEQLARHFGIDSPGFFDLLESTTEALPVDTLCFIQDRFCKLLDPEATKRSDSKDASFADLIDFKKSRTASAAPSDQ
jgi:uncharacterized protein YjbI with pentapeptide repeats